VLRFKILQREKRRTKDLPTPAVSFVVPVATAARQEQPILLVTLQRKECASKIEQTYRACLAICCAQLRTKV
jgi:hypothetical protein